MAIGRIGRISSNQGTIRRGPEFDNLQANMMGVQSLMGGLQSLYQGKQDRENDRIKTALTQAYLTGGDEAVRQSLQSLQQIRQETPSGGLSGLLNNLNPFGSFEGTTPVEQQFQDAFLNRAAQPGPTQLETDQGQADLARTQQLTASGQAATEQAAQPKTEPQPTRLEIDQAIADLASTQELTKSRTASTALAGQKAAESTRQSVADAKVAEKEFKFKRQVEIARQHEKRTVRLKSKWKSLDDEYNTFRDSHSYEDSTELRKGVNAAKAEYRKAIDKAQELIDRLENAEDSPKSQSDNKDPLDLGL